MAHDTLYIMSLPGETPVSPAPNRIPVCLGSRISPDLRLLRLPGVSPRGGVLAITCGEEIPHGNPDLLCRALLRECAARGFRGLLLDFDHPTPALSRLAALLSRHGLPLILPEWLAEHVPNCRVLIPSSLSGGSLDTRLREAVDKFGADRVVLALERAAEDFTLPAPTGCGHPLTPEELHRLIHDFRPKTQFSPALCTRYFLHCRDEEVHLVLCDDDASFHAKTACARRCGIFRFLFLQRDESAFFSNFSP